MILHGRGEVDREKLDPEYTGRGLLLLEGEGSIREELKVARGFIYSRLAALNYSLLHTLSTVKNLFVAQFSAQIEQ